MREAEEREGAERSREAKSGLDREARACYNARAGEARGRGREGNDARETEEARQLNSSPFPVAMTKGFHLFPSRTQQLSPSVPKVLGWTRPGRIGRCRIPNKKNQKGSSFFALGREKREAEEEGMGGSWGRRGTHGARGEAVRRPGWKAAALAQGKRGRKAKRKMARKNRRKNRRNGGVGGSADGSWLAVGGVKRACAGRGGRCQS